MEYIIQLVCSNSNQTLNIVNKHPNEESGCLFFITYKNHMNLGLAYKSRTEYLPNCSMKFRAVVNDAHCTRSCPIRS
jgi:hypothetical protein